MKARALEASIVFLYLHELGHHVHGDTDGKRTDDRAGLKMSREQEDAADEYAVRTALKAGYYVSAAFPLFSFIASFGGDLCNQKSSRIIHWECGGCSACMSER